MRTYTLQQLAELSVQSGCSANFLDMDVDTLIDEFVDGNHAVFYLPHPETKRCTEYRIEYNPQSQLEPKYMAPPNSAGGTNNGIPNQDAGPQIGVAWARESTYILKDSQIDGGSSNYLVYPVPYTPIQINGRKYYAYDPSGLYYEDGAGSHGIGTPIEDSYMYDREKNLWYQEFPTSTDFEEAQDDFYAVQAAAQAELDAALAAQAAYAITPGHRPIMANAPEFSNKPTLLNASTFVNGNYMAAYAAATTKPVLQNNLLTGKQTTDPFRAMTGHLWVESVSRQTMWVRDYHPPSYQIDSGAPSNLGFRIVKKKALPGQETDRVNKTAPILKLNDTDRSAQSTRLGSVVTPAKEIFSLRTEPRRLKDTLTPDSAPPDATLESFYGGEVSKLFNEDLVRAKAAFQTMIYRMQDITTQTGLRGIIHSSEASTEDLGFQIGAGTMSLMTEPQNSSYSTAQQLKYTYQYYDPRDPFPWSDYVTTYFDKK